MPISIDDSTIKIVWENNPDTSLCATNLSKSADIVASYLDYDSLSHNEGNSILTLDTENGNGLWLKLKKGTVISLINTETTTGSDTGTKILSENDHYRMFDVGLEDIWLTISDMDDNPDNPKTNWGANKEWFVYMCDKMDDSIDKENQDGYGGGGQILISQGRKFPIGQIPGYSTVAYSKKSVRKIGGFKTDSGGKIVAESIWDVSQKFNYIRSKGYYIIDEYATDSSDYNRFVNRKLRLSDLDSASDALNIYNTITVENAAKSIVPLVADVTSNTVTTGNVVMQSGCTLYQNMASNDYFKIFGAGSDDSGYLEIATGDNGTEPIYLRQYNSTAVARTAILLDADGNTIFPGNISAKSFTGIASTASAICGVMFHADSVAPVGTTRLNCEGYLYATRVYNAVWNDLAEFFLSDEKPEYGKVYCINKKGMIEKTARRADIAAIGVASDTAGYLLKQEYENKGIPIGLAGSVNVWVKSKVKSGQELVCDEDGFASPATLFESIFKRGAIIGKAITASSNNEARRILMLIK